MHRVWLRVPLKFESFFAAVRLLRLSFDMTLPEVKQYLERVGGWYAPGIILPLGVFSSEDIARMLFVLETEFADFECYPTLSTYEVSE